MDANRTRTKIHPLVAELMGYILDDLPITNLREINERLQNGTGSTPSMSPKSDFIASMLDEHERVHPEALKTLNRWILDVADEAPDLKGVSIPERTQPRSHQEVQAQLLKEDKQRIESLEKQIMIDTRERNEANRTIADQKYRIDKYIARQQFVTNKLLLAEQITRLQDYIAEEE